MPGRFVLFYAPRDDLTHGALWADAGGQRHFSAAFYAALLSDMGVAQARSLALPRADFGRCDLPGSTPMPMLVPVDVMQLTGRLFAAQTRRSL